MAARSGNPAKKAAEKKLSSVSEFKKKNTSVEELPSGMVVKLRNPGGLKAFLGTGDIPNSLMPIIQKALDKGKNVDIQNELMSDGKLDPKLLNDMMKMMDNVAVMTMVEPNLQPEPKSEEDRSDDTLYVDEVPDDDKQYIFSWISGDVKDLETFREQRESGVDAVVAIAGSGSDS